MKQCLGLRISDDINAKLHTIIDTTNGTKSEFIRMLLENAFSTSQDNIKYVSQKVANLNARLSSANYLHLSKRLELMTQHVYYMGILNVITATSQSGLDR